MPCQREKNNDLPWQVGFYINNCICAENMWRGDNTRELVMFEGTVKAIALWDFDGVKIDSCSEFSNMTRWAALFAATGKSFVLENCHNSDMQDPCPAAMACPATAVCPYNLWRTSGDIGPSWGSIFNNRTHTHTSAHTHARTHPHTHSATDDPVAR